ncbi:MAG: hypothetical protein IKK91_00530 [Ruminococcus sp.]|nr:hypothetical protein [Ruminococcus sp.]
MIFENEVTEVIRTSDGYLAKNKDTGRYLKLGVREAKFLCGLLDSDAMDTEAAPELDKEEQDYLKKVYDDFGLTVQKTVAAKRHMSDKILFVFGRNNAYCSLIKLCSHLVSVYGFVILLLTALSAGLCLNRYNETYVDSLKTVADNIGGGTFIAFYGMFIISGFIHETAHVSACYRFTGCICKTGVKFYFCIPAFFADVNDIYRNNNKAHKIVVSLMGVISNIWIICVAIIIAPFVSERVRMYLMIFVVYNMSAVIFNLIPFAKYDGYWLIQNISGINYLYDKSMSLFLVLLTKPTAFRKNNEKYKKRMTVYGFVCYAFSLYLWYVFVRMVFTLTDAANIDQNACYFIRSAATVLAVYGCITYTVKYLKKGRIYSEKITTY